MSLTVNACPASIVPTAWSDGTVEHVVSSKLLPCLWLGTGEEGVELLANAPVDRVFHAAVIFEADSPTSIQPDQASFPENGCLMVAEVGGCDKRSF